MRYHVRLYNGDDEIIAPGYTKGGAEVQITAEWPDAGTPFPYVYTYATWWLLYYRMPLWLRRAIGRPMIFFFRRCLGWPSSYYAFDRVLDQQSTITANSADLVDDTGKVIDYYPFGTFYSSSHGRYRVVLPVKVLSP